jgi:hypothetical protein
LPSADMDRLQNHSQGGAKVQLTATGGTANFCC